ncbi:MAG: mevalonate kinase family protein [Pseudomonadales bacterium]
MINTTLECSAPGKVVLWGEYAVLIGAPALVVAVDRVARCTLKVQRPSVKPAVERAAWEFTSRGYSAEPAGLSRNALLADPRPAATSSAQIAWHVLQALQKQSPEVALRLPSHADVLLDTRGFFQHGIKLGVGSSAALTVALYGTLCALIGITPDFERAVAIHSSLQSNRGSGVDIAAAWHGGLLRFERSRDDAQGLPTVTPSSALSRVDIRYFWVGHPASTASHLDRFYAWQQTGDTESLNRLADASSELFATRDILGALTHYIDRLRALDADARLGIYDASHNAMHALAQSCGVLYKPCGAGGGDIGAAFSDDPERLDRFTIRAQDTHVMPLPLETARHGIRISR